MFARGTFMYVVLFGCMRLVLKRQAGGLGVTDVLVVVLVAEVAGNGFTADYTSVVEGIVLIGTVLLWTYVVEWLAHRFPACERLFHPPALTLVENGKMLRKNMRAELVTEEELMAQLRQKGIDDCARVKHARIETDGVISVIPMET